EGEGGAAERRRRRAPTDAAAPTPPAPAPPRAETLCGPHHQATLRRLCRCERPPPPRPCSPPPAHRTHAGAPPPGRHFTPFLPQSGPPLPGPGELGEAPRQRPPQWRPLAAAAVYRLSALPS